MEDLELKKRYEKTIEINNKLYDYLSKFIKCEKHLYLSYEKYFHISEEDAILIIFSCPKYKRCFINLGCYFNRDSFRLSFDCYNNFDNESDILKNNRHVNFDLTWDKIESNDFIEFVKKELFKWGELDKINKAYEQLALF